jgi:hypothetical protein
MLYKGTTPAVTDLPGLVSAFLSEKWTKVIKFAGIKPQ